MAPLLYRGRTGGPGAVRLFSLVTGGLVLGPVVPRFVRTRGGGGGTSVVITRTPCGVLLLPVPGAHGSQRGGCGRRGQGLVSPCSGCAVLPLSESLRGRGGCEFPRLPHSVARVRRVLAFRVLYAMFSSNGCW